MDKKICDRCGKTLRKGNICQGRNFIEATLFLKDTSGTFMESADLCSKCTGKAIKIFKLKSQ